MRPRSKSLPLALLLFALLLCALAAPPTYWALVNTLGPSTEYHEPFVEGAVRLSGGEYAARVGDRIFVRYIVVRHKINGDCLLNVWRYGEFIGGPRGGERVLLDYADLRFRGANDLLRPRWPLGGFEVPADFAPAGEGSQKVALYVVARYHCNPLDEVFPRYLQGGERANETVRVVLNVRRSP